MSKTIFMIHGMWGGGWYWDKLQSSFEKNGYHCITPYLRHHNIGPNDPAPEDLGKTSLLDYAEDLEAEIKKLDERPIIIGHSMGGLLAQILAARDLAEAAVLITPASPAGIVSLSYPVVKSFYTVMAKWGFWEKPHKISYEKAVYAMMEKLPEKERKYIYSRNVWESGRATTELGLWIAGVKGAQVDSSKVTCPVLVIAGSEDKVTPAKFVKKIAKKYSPGSTYMEFANHGHWIIREPGWENVARYIKKWLESI